MAREQTVRESRDVPGAFQPVADARSELQVYVIASTDQGTLAALEAAHSLSIGFGSIITLVIPHIVPYPQALDRPLVPVSFAVARFARLAAGLDAALSFRICVCRPGDFRFDAVLAADAVVLVGGRRGVWRQTREERLVNRLSARGYHALLVERH